MEQIKEYDRIIFLNSIKNSELDIAEGTIGTCKTFIDNQVIVLYSFKNGKPLTIGVPIQFLKRATVDDLERVEDYKTLLPPNFYNGCRYSINGETGSITGIQLGLNEKQDLFTIYFDSGGEERYERKILESDAVFIPNNKVEDGIRIIIDNFEFMVFDNQIILPEKVGIGDMNRLTDSINRLSKLIKGDVENGRQKTRTS